MSRYYLYTHDSVGFTKLSKEHLALLLDLKNESWQTTHQISILNMENQLRWYESLACEDIHAPKNLVLIANADVRNGPECVGVFKLRNIDWSNRKAEAAWDVFPTLRKKGLGKKIVIAGAGFARDVLNLRKLTAEILDNNPASTKCALAAGFVQEGRKREEVYRDGKYLDSLMYGLLISPRQSKTASSS